METVVLTERQWTVLLWFIKRHSRGSGGFQDRMREWRTRMNDTMRAIQLTTEKIGRKLDDMTFIVHALHNRGGGGWQNYIFDIFANTHPTFKVR